MTTVSKLTKITPLSGSNFFRRCLVPNPPPKRFEVVPYPPVEIEPMMLQIRGSASRQQAATVSAREESDQICQHIEDLISIENQKRNDDPYGVLLSRVREQTHALRLLNQNQILVGERHMEEIQRFEREHLEKEQRNDRMQHNWNRGILAVILGGFAYSFYANIVVPSREYRNSAEYRNSREGTWVLI